MDPAPNAFTIAVVGPCAAGKSTLVRGLERYGILARQVVQEHSYVPQMWQVISKPDFLIYLEASFESCNRRKALNWQERDYDEQLGRLAHARQHCDLLVHTDGRTAESVLHDVVSELKGRKLIA